MTLAVVRLVGDRLLTESAIRPRSEARLGSIRVLVKTARRLRRSSDLDPRGIGVDAWLACAAQIVPSEA